MKKIVCLIALLAAIQVVGLAALVEVDVPMTLHSLRYDTECRWEGLQPQIRNDAKLFAEYKEYAKYYSDQVHIYEMMLYSTDQSDVQNMAFACKVVIDKYENFKETIVDPYQVTLAKFDNWIRQNDSLHHVLRELKQAKLDKKAAEDLRVTDSILTLLDNYNNSYLAKLKSMEPLYATTWNRLKQMNEFAVARYNKVRIDVIIDNEHNIVHILHNFSNYMYRIAYFSNQRYNVTFPNYKGAPYISVWSAGGIAMTLLSFFIIFLVSAAISFLILFVIKRIRKKQGKSLTIKNHILLSTSMISALCWGVLLIFNEVQMFEFGVSFYAKFSILLAVIMLSLSLRLIQRRLTDGIMCYLPVILACLILLICRATVMPDDIMNVFFCPIVLCFIIWRAVVLRKKAHLLQPIDRNLLRIGSVVFITAFILGLFGYQFVGSMLIIFWATQLVFALGVTCLQFWLHKFVIKNKKLQKKHKKVQELWYVVFVQQVFLPALWIWSIFYSAHTAARVYALDDMMYDFLSENIIPDEEINLSIFMIFIVICVFLVCRYIVHIVPKMLQNYYERKKTGNYIGRLNIFRNIFSVIIWGLFIVYVFLTLKINTSWIGYTVTGLAAGLGLASKGMLEDIFYGIILLSGRVKVGDWVICEGIRGQIKSINFLDTVMISVDGTVITMKNSQLFEKNYENLTLNHGWELLHVRFSVDYGQDINNIREILINNFKDSDLYDHSRPLTVHCYGLGENGLMLDFRPWTLAKDHIAVNAAVTEYVYNTLTQNGISCSFPQCEIHIHDKKK